MRLSIHDNDDNFGNIGAAIGSLIGLNLGGAAVGQVQSGAAREVVIEIKGTVSRAFFWAYNEPEWIGDVLRARGWDIRRVAEVNSGAIVTDRTWHVYARVFSQYSDAQIVSNARNHLVERGMSVTSVRIAQASAAAYISTNVSGGDGSIAAKTFDSIVANTSLGVGISTPFLLAGGAVILILLLKR